MGAMDWPRVCSLLAHELRSPSAVIAGYARMLGEGRLAGDDRAQAYAQIERAATRITAIGRQASDLARWLEPPVAPAAPRIETVGAGTVYANSQTVVGHRTGLQHQTGDKWAHPLLPQPRQGGLHKGLLRLQFGAIRQSDRDQVIDGLIQRNKRYAQVGSL